MRHVLVQSGKHEKRDPELWQKAQVLKASPLFVGTTDSTPLVEKQAVFLALIGLKPVSEASSGHWVPRPGGRRSVYDDPAAVGALLDSLGLVCRLRHDEYATDALVALWPGSLETYTTAATEGDQQKLGELFGYPATAATAFADGDDHLLPLAEQKRLERAVGGLPMLRFSRTHWREELQVVQRWQAVLGLYELLEP